MRDFLKNSMEQIYNDFIEELDNMDCCCELKNLRFDSANIPNYSNRIIQQLYLLRYFPAYLFEYFDVYSDLIKKHSLEDYNVLSIGSGCGIDYYGLHFALDRNNESICYTGVDKINWSYRFDLENDEYYFINEDISNWDKLDWDGYNILIFPKSIGEFTEKDFKKLLDMLRRSKFKHEDIYIISSIRELNDDIDTRRLVKIINVLEKKHKYKCLDDKTTYTHYIENVGIRKFFDDFIYPDEILSEILQILNHCNKYKENGYNSCEHDCESLLNKWPILKTGHIKYQIKKLSK
ncbi:hypothetical protein [Tepidibacter hydrothermalis]|uniref:Class I SAM-dependent methyltransferase n=1 Tax=Tepidibacter hydrothermalis TaxID=3036126 RepID=A0ABY8EE63_9FIRM|nr:hypothetical protein [Tepidibacter hydrothermalis]WFD09777.1 hypothetical protein P4S50_15470 [Tepidibacter hydrothermalis]